MIISVIIPVFNCEKYISKCIESLVKSDVSADDIEFIFVDDGSTDNSINVIKNYNDKRIRIIEKTHSNVYETRKIGILNAKGSYIMSVDADDFVKPELFADMLEKLNYNDCDLIVFNYCKYLIKNNKKIISPKMIKMKEGLYKKGTPEFQAITTPKFENSGFGTYYYWNKVIKKEKCVYIFNNVIGIDNYCCCFSEDRKMITFIFLLTDNVLYVDKLYYFYRITRNSTCHNINTVQSRFHELENYFKLIKANQEKFKIDKNFYENLVVYVYGLHYFYLAKQKHFDLSKVIYNKDEYATLIKKYNFSNRMLGFALKHNMKRFIYIVSLILKK